ncbi:MAG: hypothetical protein HWN81_14975 [Candidatus Lokiarchaeota archaeon]|nr:hypothetical protein [Candidatus Lokiarchaeota archaeon]
MENHTINKSEQTRYFIVSNGHIHYGMVEQGQVMDTSLPNLEIFTVKEDWVNRLIELGIDYEDEIDY